MWDVGCGMWAVVAGDGMLWHTYLAKAGVVAQFNHGAAGVVRRKGDVRDDHGSHQASRVGCRNKEGGSGRVCTNSTPHSEYGGRQVENSCS